MAVKIYIWKPLGGVWLNVLIYELFLKHFKCLKNIPITSAGHVAMEITTKDGYSRYISHRPQEDNNSSFNKKSNIKYQLTASDTFYEQECLDRRANPIVMYEIHGLDEDRMIRHYELNIFGTYSEYHVFKNNCAILVIKLIFQGANSHHIDDLEYVREYLFNPYNVRPTSSFITISICSLLLALVVIQFSFTLFVYIKYFTILCYLSVILLLVSILVHTWYNFKIISFIENFWTPDMLDEILINIKKKKFEQFNHLSVKRIDKKVHRLFLWRTGLKIIKHLFMSVFH
jgi:hypothetical protein